LRVFPQIKILAVKLLFSALLFSFLSIFLGVMPLPWLYLPLLVFIFVRPLFKVAIWIYAGLMVITVCQLLVLNAVYPKQYQPDDPIYFYGGTGVTPFFHYQLQLSPKRECAKTKTTNCGYQLRPLFALFPTKTCVLQPREIASQTLGIRAGSGFCLFNRAKLAENTTAQTITVHLNPEMQVLHGFFIYSAFVLLVCVFLLNNIRQRYRQPASAPQRCETNKSPQ
jgi:hypothetical protein